MVAMLLVGTEGLTDASVYSKKASLSYFWGINIPQRGVTTRAKGHTGKAGRLARVTQAPDGFPGDLDDLKLSPKHHDMHGVTNSCSSIANC